MSFTRRHPSAPAFLGVLMTVVLMVVVGSSYASAQDSSPVSVGDLVTDRPDGTTPSNQPLLPSETLELSGTGYAPFSEVSIVLQSDPILLTTVMTDAAGSFSVTISLPSRGVPSGEHTLKASGPAPGGGIRVLERPVVLDERFDATAGLTDDRATPSASPEVRRGSLPVTGGAIAGLATVGAAAIALGVVLTRRARA